MVARRLPAALMVSVLLHAVVFVSAWIPLPTQAPASVPLQAWLAEEAAPAPVAKPHTTSVRPRAKVARRAPPPPPEWSAPQIADATPLALPAAPPMVEPEPSSTGEAEPDEMAEVEPEPSPLAPAAPTTAEANEPAPARQLPAAGELTYTLFLGSDGFSVGRSTYSWTVDGNAYRLVSDSETTGIVDFFRPQRLIYISEGKLTAGGLRPERFTMMRTKRGVTDEARAHLDWDAHELTYGRPADLRTVALPATSQDIMSFILQLALNPPARGRIHLPITNGLRMETYEIEVRPEEAVDTPLGSIMALPLKQIRKEGAEGIEVWLAVEYPYLPVKVRFRDREGRQSGEQVVSTIRVGQP